MQRFMLKLDGFLRRHRAVVVVVWLLALVAAVPFAAKQSDHLTGGGFAVPGSQSKTVEDRLARDFPGSERTSLAAVLRPEKGATAADMRAALDRLDRATEEVPRVALAERVQRQAAAQLAGDRPRGDRPLREGDRPRGGDRPLVVPLAASVPDRDATDVARDLREAIHAGEAEGGVA